MSEFSGATATITGGTGSLGSTMVNNRLRRGVSQISILSRDEAKQDLMRRQVNDERVRLFLVNVRYREHSPGYA